MVNIIKITDLALPELAWFAHLTEPQLRNKLEPGQGIFIAESPKVINLALKAGCQPLALLMETKRLAGQGQAIIQQCGDIPVYTGDREVLAGLTGYTLTRGILCAMRRPDLAPAAELCADARRVAVLDGIADATNVGAIFRSAAALDVDAVLVLRSACDPLCRRSVRVSMGTIFQVPWTWLEGGLGELKHMGFKTAALALSDQSVSLDDPALAVEDKLALVFGTEGYGLSQEVLKDCDYVVKIPMARQVDSLNVAAASAVAFWQLRVRRY